MQTQLAWGRIEAESKMISPDNRYSHNGRWAMDL
jgi:hypothetical protein